MGFKSGEFDAIPPGIAICTIQSVKAPTIGRAGEVNISLRWEDVEDNCSGVWYYEIVRDDSVISIDSSRTEVHTFTEKNVKNDTTLLTFLWKIHAVDRVGNRQAVAPACSLPFVVTPPDSGSCVNDTTFCWSKGASSLPEVGITYVVEGARFAEFFGNDQTDNVIAGPMDSQCLDFARPWEQVYWRVKAQVDNFESAWSDTFFCTLNPEHNLTSVETDDSHSIPEKFRLKQNYPNPFNPTTTIRYTIPRVEESAPRVLIEIFNLGGQKIRALVNREMPPGEYSVVWDAKDDFGNLVGSGVYVYRMRVQDFVSSQKMIFLK
ncbi:T9SS type A sorting domain-containing protein [candidate division KSB1 bacterium]|nr:T9SS type A sorting domain-containing protein [candidate division KSB1 bacterium]NIR68874.1 T9SS type A sorting domain-containing protein [candidate division KSB1 bacterium]NIS27242.1 T9SS type A sorting domain-containing protein [candidate division KSB1 bacterium]NIT74127.1 T9SS type A sorting domain-containing protein [candidate division KSB1 bacterium]NIU27976.1 T9SS type A sorting domain-containing protein [candidate division KSB1 bacterium]